MAQKTIEALRNAELDADMIIKNADTAAEEIISDAKKEAEKIILEAEQASNDKAKREIQKAHAQVEQMLKEQALSTDAELKLLRENAQKKEAAVIEAVIQKII